MEGNKMWETASPQKSEKIIDEKEMTHAYREDLNREDPEKEDEEQAEGGNGEES